MLLEIFIFLTLAFPKAGMMISGVPVTVAELLFGLIFIVSFIQIKKINVSFEMIVLYLIYSLFLLINLAFNIEGTNISSIFTLFILMISPIAFLIGKLVDRVRFVKYVTSAVIITSLFAILQKSFGVLNVNVQGITESFGTAIQYKPIGLVSDGMAFKMPSTYQNGNGLGLFLALSLPLLIGYRFDNRIWQAVKNISLILGLIGLILSGTRSSMIPFFIFVPYILYLFFKRNFNKAITWIVVVVSLLILLIIYFYYVRPAFIFNFFDDYILRTINDKTGNQRIPQIRILFNQLREDTGISYLRDILIGVPWVNSYALEGVFSVIGYHGFLGLPILYGLWISPIFYIWKKNKFIAIGLLFNIIAWMVDGSFNFPPYLMNYFLFVGVGINWKDERIEKNSHSDGGSATGSRS
ncbi:hypothetical protein [Apilactobacillus timberlakei]|uniref:Polysaccharide polymerase n=1 Tax=Apilactobacillus timberlakei TaxID=2008380 RepID=A0ABY2YV65_9LACO|nr:hypothetical protein [Apilactobacillus timberlakei]TPR15788.1 hypothetical protein DY052_04200 [Apilactobacillus timberlakei]TPR16149.1 hypothetical protein DY048_01415 [Apilactobacillus timberlakei]